MNNLDILSILQRDKLQRLRRESNLHRLSEGLSLSPTATQRPVASLIWVGQHPQKPLEPLS